MVCTELRFSDRGAAGAVAFAARWFGTLTSPSNGSGSGALGLASLWGMLGTGDVSACKG